MVKLSSIFIALITLLIGCTTIEEMVDSGQVYKGMRKSDFFTAMVDATFADDPTYISCFRWYVKETGYEVLSSQSRRVFWVFKDVTKRAPASNCSIPGNGLLDTYFLNMNEAISYANVGDKETIAKTEKKPNKEIQKHPEPVKPDDLFFSEYAEGQTASNTNRYLEIFNPTNEDISLDNYAYPGDFARDDYWNNFPKGAVIRANDFYIICSGYAAPEIMSECDSVSVAFKDFDGGEAIRLVKGKKSGYTVIDTIGVGVVSKRAEGFKVCGNGNTNNSVLIKKPSRTGNPDWYKSRGTSASDCDWIVKMNINHGKSGYDGDWSGLGNHTFNGQTYIASKQSPIPDNKKPPVIARKKPESNDAKTEIPDNKKPPVVARKKPPSKKAKTDENKIRKIANGSGFFVNSDGYLVSNYHVVEICESVKTSINGNIYDVSIIATDNVNDLMIGRIDDLSGNNYLFINTKGAYLGDNVLAAGFPLADSLSDQIKVTRGIVSSMSGPGNNYSQYQIDAAVQGGNSGGPLLDDSGNVVGVVVAQLNKYKFLTSAKTIPENVNFAIKSQNVELFLDANRVPYSSKTSTYQVENRQIAQSAERATVNLACYNSIANLKDKYGE